MSRSRIPRNASAVSRRGSVATWLTSTPSAASVSRTNRPLCSSPTRVSMAGRRPRRAHPTAVFAGEPPRYLAKLNMSSRRPPVCSPYRSTAARPTQMTSNGRPLLTPPSATRRSARRDCGRRSPRAPARGTAARPASGTGGSSSSPSSKVTVAERTSGESGVSVITITGTPGRGTRRRCRRSRACSCGS